MRLSQYKIAKRSNNKTRVALTADEREREFPKLNLDQKLCHFDRFRCSVTQLSATLIDEATLPIRSGSQRERRMQSLLL